MSNTASRAPQLTRIDFAVLPVAYVNGEYRGDSDIGKLMHDFNCTDAADMNFKLLADRTRYLTAHWNEIWPGAGLLPYPPAEFPYHTFSR